MNYHFICKTFLLKKKKFSYDKRIIMIRFIIIIIII